MAVVGAAILLAAMLAPVVAALITAIVTPFVVASVAVFVARLRLWFLAGVARKSRDCGLVAHAWIDRFAVGVLARVADIGPMHGTMALAVGVGWIAALLSLLLAVGDDHAVIVFGVLEVVLGQDGIARGLRVASERDILASDVRGRAPDLYIRTIRLKAAREWVLPFAVVMIVAAITTAAAAATPAAMLLTLPHRLPFFPRRVLACPSTPEP
jgi:hypothetical protein